MPTYYAAGVSVRLSTTSIHDSLSETILSGHGVHVRHEKERVQDVLASGEVLAEGFPNTDDDLHLGFLGRDTPVPFYCVGVSIGTGGSVKTMSHGVQALRTTTANENKLPKRNKTFGSSKVKQIEPSSRASLKPSLSHRALTTPQPRALAISVELDKVRTFCRSRYPDSKTDVKIEVLFNGQLTNATYVSKPRSNEQGKMKIYFSGKRIDRLVEAAWLLFPPPMAKIGASTASPSQKEDQAHENVWNQIAASLRLEADCRGFDDDGLRPPSGEYLENLANHAMPQAIKMFQSRPGCKLGIIDVIITLGDGKKYGTQNGYLRQPHRLQDTRFNPKLSPNVSSRVSNGCSSGGIGSPSAIRTPHTVLPNNTFATPSSSNAVPALVSCSDSTHQISLMSSPTVGNEFQTQRESIGFLNAVRKCRVEPIKDLDNYGVGPQAANPPSPFVQSPNPSILARREPEPSRWIPKSATEAQSSFLSRPPLPLETPLATPGASDQNLHERRLYPSPRFRSTLTIRTSNDRSDAQNLCSGLMSFEESTEQHDSSPCKRRRMEARTSTPMEVRAPSYSPITPNGSKEFTTAAQSVETSAEFARNNELEFDACSVPVTESTANVQIDALGLSLATTRGYQLLRDLTKNGLGNPPNLNNQPVAHSPLQRLARHPFHESNDTELGFQKIFLTELPFHENLAILPPNGQECRSPSTPANRKLIMKLKLGSQHGKSKKSEEETATPSSAARASSSDQTISPTKHSPPLKIILKNKNSVVAKNKSDVKLTMPTQSSPKNPQSKNKYQQRATLSTPSMANLTTATNSLEITATRPEIKLKLNNPLKEAETSKHNRSPYAPPSFEIPNLSRDCIISYMSRSDAPADATPLKDKPKTTGPKLGLGGTSGGGAYRQVASERTGQFVESEVLLGVRFVVGSV